MREQAVSDGMRVAGIRTTTDGRAHLIIIEYLASTTSVTPGKLSVYVDNKEEPLLQIPFSLARYVELDGSAWLRVPSRAQHIAGGRGWVGFTSTSGYATTLAAPRGVPARAFFRL